VSEDSGFTRFLRNLEPGRPLDRESRELEEAWAALRRLLVSELRRRSLWSLPPAYLGIYGCASWNEPEAVEELLAECFVFIFVERFRSLKAQLRSKSDIEGLVLRNVRNFLQETQRRHDPVGFRVFTVLRSAVRNLLAAGELRVIAGNPGVQRDTVLTFGSVSSEEAVRLEELRPHVLAWNECRDELDSLRSLDIVHLQGRGRGTHYVLNESLYDGATQEGGTSRKPVLARETKKTLLLKHIEDNRIAGSKMEELRQVLPAHSRSQIQVLLRELRSDDRIHVHGATRAALWYPGPETEDCNHE
jgi:hypothetical protein